jgi:hypothetical protein
MELCEKLRIAFKAGLYFSNGGNNRNIYPIHIKDQLLPMSDKLEIDIFAFQKEDFMSYEDFCHQFLIDDKCNNKLYCHLNDPHQIRVLHRFRSLCNPNFEFKYKLQLNPIQDSNKMKIFYENCLKWDDERKYRIDYYNRKIQTNVRLLLSSYKIKDYKSANPLHFNRDGTMKYPPDPNYVNNELIETISQYNYQWMITGLDFYDLFFLDGTQEIKNVKIIYDESDWHSFLCEGNQYYYAFNCR